ncbi:putative amidohydrolase [Algimonas ampicilliniresistens]|uniref:Amidohydrolase n=1 Tax=Algimonas ampicilliniresistens TaxID=1298735 RepID=A0ABQ5V975_9PROT|nr:amidohydrolase [Algimonas ampicilliniresistens]GLQ23590.1 putative amidohydrolase [Algimonas ampicilliniresistens]
MKRSIFAAALLFAATPALSADIPTDLSDHIQADYDANLSELFVHFHKNPELSFREFETSKRIASELTALGFDVTTEVGQTGVVAVLKNGDGPTVMIRADMDGLPVKEDSGLPYASTRKQVGIEGVENYVMHACGHDVHVTSLIGTGRQMVRLKDNWAGTLVLIGQPAEEIISGARAMIQDGLYERFPTPDYIIGFHVGATGPAGKIMVPKGLAYSSSDSVDVDVRGVGTHGAAPHQGVDPVLVASAIVVNLQSIVSRSISPLQPGVITVGSFHGGTKNNIIGDKVELKLTVRSDDPEVRATLLDSIDRVARGTAIAYGVPEDLLPIVTRLSRNTAPLRNDTETATFLESQIIENMGADSIVDPVRLGMGAEDFAEFIAPEHEVTGVYLSVGGTPMDELSTAASHHSPFFKIAPEPSITAGTEAMTVSAISLFNRD